MIAIGILAAAVVTVGVAQTIRLVATDGRRRVPTRTYPDMFSIR